MKGFGTLQKVLPDFELSASFIPSGIILREFLNLCSVIDAMQSNGQAGRGKSHVTLSRESSIGCKEKEVEEEEEEEEVDHHMGNFKLPDLVRLEGDGTCLPGFSAGNLKE